MSTLRRELRQAILKKIEELESSDVIDVGYEGNIKYDQVADELANVAISVFEAGKKPAKPTNDPMWNFLHGIESTQEEIDENVIALEATTSFERDLKFGQLPWSSTKDWENMYRFVVQEYKKDKLIFSKYKTWQQNEGKFVAMSNRKIRERPADFIDCWPDFLAHSEMYSPKQTQQSFVEEDDNGIPKSY